MKRLSILIILFIFLSSLPSARALDTAQRQLDTFGGPALEDAVSDQNLPPLTLDLDFGDGLRQLGSSAGELGRELVRSAVRSGLLLLLVALFAGIAGKLDGGLSSEVQNGVRLVSVLTVTGLSMADAGGLIGLGREAIRRMDEFSTILIPVMTTACTAAGNGAGASARQGATLICSKLLITLIDRVLVPAVYLYIGAAAAASLAGNEGLGAVARLVNWGVKSALTTILLLYTGFLSFAGVTAGGADALTLRLTKTAISGLVPVVGGILSDTADTVLAGAGVVRGAVGIFGVLAVLALCLSPFLALGVQYLVYRVTAVLAAVFSDGTLSALIGEIGSAFGLVLGMTGAVALMLLISLFAAMSAALPV